MAGGTFSRTQRGHGRRAAYRPMSEINVTPLVDVMLVLLIVFMVAAPLLATGVPVDLPKAQAPALNDKQKSLTISVRADGKLFLSDNAEREVPDDALVPRLQAVRRNNPEIGIFVRGDQAINYGRVIQVMGMLNAAGIDKVGLVTDAPREPRAAPRRS